MISDFLANGILDALFNATPFSIGTVKISLHTASPARTGANEVAGGSYARLACTFDPAADRATQNDILLTFADMPACTVTHVGFWDDASPPNFLKGTALPVPKSYLAGGDAKITIGSLDETIDWT